MFSRFEIFGAIAAIVVIVAMGVITFTGPFHKVNKPPSAAAAAPPVKTVQIVTDPRTIGRYSPASATIKVGQAIKFKNVSNAPHTVTADNNSFDSHLIETGGQTWIF